MPLQQERKLPTGEFFSEFHTNYFEEDQQPNTAFTLIDEGISDGVVVSAVASSFVASSNEEGRPSYGYILYQSDSQAGVRPLSEVLDGKSEKTFVHCSIFIDSLHRRRKRKRTTRRPTPRPTPRLTTRRPTPRPTTRRLTPTETVRCPCFDQDDLSAVTPGTDVHCTVYDGYGGESFVLTYGDKFFETAPDEEEPGTFQCDAGSAAGPSSTLPETEKKISKEQYKRCFQELEDRCDEIQTPVETIVCPCFGQDDLLVATSENFDVEWCPNILTTPDGPDGFYFFGIGIEEGSSIPFCFSRDGGQLTTTVRERNLCLSLVMNRCLELMRPKRN